MVIFRGVIFFFENRFAEDLCGYATKQLKELLIAIVGENH